MKDSDMPVHISKNNGKYSVQTPGQTHAYGTTRRKAERQARLLRAIDHGWHPTKSEAIHAEAAALVGQLLEVDEIGSLPIPASGKRNARMSGMRGLRTKQQNFINMNRDLGDRGKSTRGFRNYDGSEFTGRKTEGMDSAPVTQRLEKTHTEKTRFSGGRYGKGVASHGKTGGKFRMPGNWSVGHAMKD